MCRDDTFSQRNKATKKAGGKECTKFEKGGVSNIGGGEGLYNVLCNSHGKQR